MGEKSKINDIDQNNGFYLLKLHQTVLIHSISDYRPYEIHILTFSVSTDLKNLHLGLIWAKIRRKMQNR